MDSLKVVQAIQGNPSKDSNSTLSNESTGCWQTNPPVVDKDGAMAYPTCF
ncbi:hypothetical protein PVK06_048798 [Gossypium arboreum]|uniref:Uncharacterized protein n=1 Tax=Gossypium arboreum TaxID=29729 RepID=A0ABR0MGY9_GOSAR|nr:hypothetical protein PVK06_048798 [Gossypium arboreum]